MTCLIECQLKLIEEKVFEELSWILWERRELEHTSPIPRTTVDFKYLLVETGAVRAVSVLPFPVMQRLKSVAGRCQLGSLPSPLWNWHGCGKRAIEV